MSAAPQILVAGIGNIFLGDDAFGSEVARALLRRPQSPHVRIVDFGIRGLDLVYALLDGCEMAILIDAVPRPDEPPGTLFLLEPNLTPPSEASPVLDAHSMDPVKVLHTAVALGANPARVLIVGCQPSAIPTDEEEFPAGMSVPVAAAVEEAVAMVESLILQYSSAQTGPLHPIPSQENLPCPS